jgi:hypothetical protein
MTSPVPTQSHLARLAYETYRRATGGRSYRGEPLPDFEDVSVPIQAAWIAAVTAVRDAVLTPPES